MQPPTKTPILNRLFFATITAFFILAALKTVFWAMYQGREPFKFPLWLAIFGTAIVGYTLITWRGDIKLRLHKIWTPLGILMMVWIYYFMIIVALPHSSGVWDLLVYQSSDAFLFATSFGLLVAFVDWKVLYKYAYYFIPVALFDLFYELIGAFISLPMILIQKGFQIPATQINEMNDFFVLLSVFLYGYYAVKRFRTQRPTWRNNGVKVIIFLVILVVLLVINGAVLSQLPPSNWFFRWIRA